MYIIPVLKGYFNEFIDGEVDHLDYEKRFPPDEEGKEGGPNARVWKVYLNEAGQFDVNMIKTMRDTADVVLVFVSDCLLYNGQCPDDQSHATRAFCFPPSSPLLSLFQPML